MGETTAISWADATVNFWMGCTAVSPACDGCYARNLVQDRFGKAVWGGPGSGAGTRTRTGQSSWRLPFKLQRRAEKDGTRPFVFVNSLADTFDNAVPGEWRAEAFDVMRRTPRLVYLLLTKRPQLIARLAEAAGGLPPNAAIGTTVEDQERADRNVPCLLDASEALWRAKTKPLFTFLSCEPLLGHVDLTSFEDGTAYRTDALRGHIWIPAGTNKIPGTSYIVGDRDYVSLCHGINWVITGGETDQGSHKARPTHPGWFRSLRDQCAAAGVPFHHKQNGEWASVSEMPGPGEHFAFPGGATVRRVGKYRAGRLIDGVLHDARPAVPAMEAAHG